MQATKSIISGTNTQALTAKADLLKEEVDEAMNKVELCKVSCCCSSIITQMDLILMAFFIVGFVMEKKSAKNNLIEERKR